MKNNGGSKVRSAGKACTITLGGREVKYILKRTNRRSIGISIDRMGAVTVAAPIRVSDNTISELLKKKALWIIEKLTKLETMSAQWNRPKGFTEGEEFSYLGTNYKLRFFVENALKRPVIRLGRENLEIYCKNPEAAEVLRDYIKLWYVEQFKGVIEERVLHFSRLIGVKTGKITIREQKTRWGSCSSKGNLNFNWKLIMAPAEVLDYVVIHELCHLREMNHSSRFWTLVEDKCPEYKQYRKWLKENGSRLSID